MSHDFVDESLIKSYAEAVRKQRNKPQYHEQHAEKLAKEMMASWRKKKAARV